MVFIERILCYSIKKNFEIPFVNTKTGFKNKISHKAKKNEEMKIYIIHFHLYYTGEKPSKGN